MKPHSVWGELYFAVSVWRHYFDRLSPFHRNAVATVENYLQSSDTLSSPLLLKQCMSASRAARKYAERRDRDTLTLGRLRHDNWLEFSIEAKIYTEYRHRTPQGIYASRYLLTQIGDDLLRDDRRLVRLIRHVYHIDQACSPDQIQEFSILLDAVAESGHEDIAHLIRAIESWQHKETVIFAWFHIVADKRLDEWIGVGSQR